MFGKEKGKDQTYAPPEFPDWVPKYPVSRFFPKDLKKVLAEGSQRSTGYSAGYIRTDRKYPIRPRIYPVDAKSAKDISKMLAEGCWGATGNSGGYIRTDRNFRSGPDISGELSFG